MWTSFFPTPPSTVAKTTLEKTSRGVRFTLHDVKPANNPPRGLPAKAAFSELLETPLEACNFDDDSEEQKFLSETKSHPLIVSAHRAWAEHRPLVISPDAVFLSIVQGLAHHINLNPEKFRDKLVDHKGKKDLLVTTDLSPVWTEVFEEFCQQLSQQQKGGKMSDWAQPSFSTTGPLEQAAFQVAFMDIMKPYHNFVILAACGIPSIELTGTPEDWRELESRLDMLDNFEMGWWAEALKPLCRKFVEASEGNIDLEHWSAIIKHGHTYGSDLVDGWLCKFVPYLVDYLTKEPKHRNPLLECGKESEGIRPDSLPKGVSMVPFRLENMADGTVSSKEFIAGLAGIKCNSEGALEANMGWAVRPRPGLTMALDILEERGLLEQKADADDEDFRDKVAAELIEIEERCIGGARLCTKSGRLCGRIFAKDQRPLTKYVRGDNGGARTKSSWLCGPIFAKYRRTKYVEGDNGKVGFQTKLEREFDSSWSDLPPGLRKLRSISRYNFSGWRGIGEIDGKSFGVKMGNGGANNNIVFFFSACDGTDKFTYEEIKDKDLGAIIMEVLNRQ